MSTPQPQPGAGDPSPGAGSSSLPAPPARTGTVAWALGFLAYLPIPFGNLVIAGLVQLLVGLAQRKHGGVAAANGVRAANWGLTLLCWPVLMAAALALGFATATPTPDGTRILSTPMEVVIFGLIGVYVLLCIAQMIYSIAGTLQSSRGKAVQLPVIPFLRDPRD